jgi:protein-serine/threonine kinase
MTPQSNAPSFTPAPSELQKLQTDSQSIGSQSTDSSHPSSPESRPVDLRSAIPEEEEEDETSSETANEPLTPTDSHHPHTFQDTITGKPNGSHTFAPIHSKPPLILNTPATPPPSAGSQERTPVADSQTPKSPLQKRPPISPVSTKDLGIKRAMSGLFRRSNSQNGNLGLQPLTPSQVDGSTLSCNGSDTMLAKGQRRMSATTSPYTTRSNTPPSPSSPAENDPNKPQLAVQEPSEEDFLANGRKKNRSSTGFGIRDRLSKHKITFAQQNPPTNEHRRHRATSVDLNSPAQESNRGNIAHLPQRQIWGLAADSGTGLKARRMSLSLPDDFVIDVVELYTEYSNQSKLVGRRGKSVGKGATANVNLMVRKGGPSDEVYAVKEFRGKSVSEKAEDYEQKVKSEYSIAKSVHHPNIVETLRLCTHNGRWNHVMEFCDQGDLFNLVNQRYLSREDHLVDRLCLFKQLIQGLNYLHNNGIAHRDVKLENLLITKDSKLKITDFGVSEVFCGIHPGLRSAGGQCGKEMGEVRRCAPGMCGSPPYVAPEVIAKNGELNETLSL